MRWPWVSRARLDDLKAELADRKQEVRGLTDTIILMRKEGFGLRPEHTDQAWPGGKYVMSDEDEEDQPAKAETWTYVQDQPVPDPSDDTMLARMIDEDVRRAFPEED